MRFSLDFFANKTIFISSDLLLRRTNGCVKYNFNAHLWEPLFETWHEMKCRIDSFKNGREIILTYN